MKKVLMFVLGIGLVLAGVQPASAKTLKLATVDLGKVFKEFEGTKTADAELKADIQTRQKQIDEKKEAVAKMRKDYENKSVILSDAEKQKKSDEINSAIKDLQAMMLQANKELKEKEMSLTSALVKKIESVIQSISKDKDYDLVLDKHERVVLFSDDALDITDQVLKALSETHGK